MKQLLVHKGTVRIEDVPPPAISENEVLIQTAYSLISTGTELAGLATSSQSLLTRALTHPQHVKKAMKMAAEKGVLATYKIISGMLDFGTPAGYSLSGTVLEVGKNVEDLKKGDLVACAGAGMANHAEFVAVPRLLVSRIPEGCDLRSASSVTLGAIAMQGVRQANVRLGETVVVIGLGLIGQLTCQLLKASGCRVIGIDLDEKRNALAKSLGADFAFEPNSVSEIKQMTDGYGVDAAIITASTKSSEPLKQAMEITRRKGTVVVVGAIGLELDRSPWYEKEIDLKISCSYGPGRYDPTYEEGMVDYPLPYVRWTLNRNMESYLRLIAEKKVNFLGLLPKEFLISEASAAFAHLEKEKPLAVLLAYSVKTNGATFSQEKKISLTPRTIHSSENLETKRLRLAVIGAGTFAMTTHLPNIKKLSSLFDLRAIVSKKGTTAKQHGENFGAQYCTTDVEEVLKDPDIDAVLIATRHNLHAPLVLKALTAGKHVFVEKPLALNRSELDEIRNFFETQAPNSKLQIPSLFVGFNRRFSPYAARLKELTLNRKNPIIISYRVNAGYLPLDHWTHGPEGGGRIIGETCHFLDFFQFLIGVQPVKTEVTSLNPHTKDTLAKDNFSATISYKDGSVANLLYTALGPKELPKEYAEIYWDGKAALLYDFKKLEVTHSPGSMKTIFQDKGHTEELKAFAEGIVTGKPPIPLEEIFQTTELSFQINDAI